MDVTAFLTRIPGRVLALVICAALAACAPRATGGDRSPASVDSGVVTAQTEALPFESAQPVAQPPATFARLMDPSDAAFGMDMISGSSFDRLVIDSLAGAPEYKAIRLEAPSRIVLDLFGASGARSDVITGLSSDLITQLRIGAHPDKTRLVLDLRDTGTIEYRTDVVDGKIVLTIAESAAMQTALNTPISTGMAGASETIEARAAFSPEEETAQAEQTWAKEAVERGSTSQIAAAKPSAARVLGLAIENVAGKGASLVVDIDNPGSYSFKRTTPSEFVLTLNDTTLDPAAANQILAPPAQKGAPQIRSVRPVVQGNDVLVRMFASPDAELSAVRSGSKIVVSALALSQVISGEEPRAQAADEKPEAAAPDADEAAEVKVSDSPAPTEGEEDFGSLLVDVPAYTGRLISLDLQDTDIDNALRIIAEVSNLNIIASDDVTGKVTLRLIDVPWDQALDVILKTNALDKVQEGNVIRIAPVEKLRLEREALKQAQDAEQELAPLVVKYVRISYAKASELKPLVESVITERGTVAYDERTNQLIVKDTAKGVKNVAQLVAKVDLRTPQVLLETQIVEAERSLSRALGTELGFNMIRSPETGNATGYNFPNSIALSGGVSGDTASSFPVAIGDAGGAAVLLGLESADGSKSLDMRISALEEEGRVRVISRPSVATTNNKEAIIKSVEKIRIKTPDGGLSVATGSGASASSSSAVATEVVEIGITLTVTPQASPDFYVLLDIKAKSSTFGSEEVDGIPSEVERSANSTVLVASGQTFAMGGIYKITDNDRVAGVPFLKDIPVIGHLFRRVSVDNGDEELIFFITPRIIEGSFDDAAMKSAS